MKFAKFLGAIMIALSLSHAAYGMAVYVCPGLLYSVNANTGEQKEYKRFKFAGYNQSNDMEQAKLDLSANKLARCDSERLKLVNTDPVISMRNCGYFGERMISCPTNDPQITLYCAQFPNCQEVTD